MEKNGYRFSHPRVCDKMFKYGFEKERGCSGKNCPNFHPSVCKTQKMDAPFEKNVRRTSISEIVLSLVKKSKERE